MGLVWSSADGVLDKWTLRKVDLERRDPEVYRVGKNLPWSNWRCEFQRVRRD